MRTYASRYNFAPLLPKDALVTIFVLGRGVNMDGTLPDLVKRRVEAAIDKANWLISNSHQVRIIWTGGMARKLASRGQHPAAREAQAMYDYAKTLPGFDKVTDQMIEDQSTNTVENALNSAKYVLKDSIILVMSDDLHFKWGRVAFIMWLCFPKHKFHQITIGRQVSGLKPEITQVFSMAALLLVMAGVRRGDLRAIRDRQNWLNRRSMRKQLN